MATTKKKKGAIGLLADSLKGFTANPKDEELLRQQQVQQQQQLLRQQQEVAKATTTEEKAPPRADNKTPEAYIDTKTGKPSGISKNGQSFLGGSVDEVQGALTKEAQSRALPAGINVVGSEQNLINSAAAQQQQQLRNAQLIQMAQQGQLTPQELAQIQGAPLDFGQAAGAGALNVLPGAIGGAATGAVAGAAAGGGVTPLAAGLAAVGAIGGFLVGMRNSIKSEQSEEFAADQVALTKGQTLLRGLITDTNQNPQNAPENIELFYKTLNMIDAAHQKTWKDSQEDLNKFLGNDGSDKLAKFETFNALSRQYYINRFEAALNNPDPSQILVSEEELGVYNEETN